MANTDPATLAIQYEHKRVPRKCKKALKKLGRNTHEIRRIRAFGSFGVSVDDFCSNAQPTYLERQEGRELWPLSILGQKQIP